MTKTIIAIWGKSSQGKSKSIKNVCRIILDIFENAVPSIPINKIDYSKDIRLTIEVGSVKIGIESQGDPNSRMFDTIENLAKENCDIIICATRTSGATPDKIHEIANEYNYSILWKTNYTSSTISHEVLNRIAAQDTVGLIKSIIAGELFYKPEEAILQNEKGFEC